MKTRMLAAIVALAFPAASLAQNGAAPTIAFDITQAQIDNVLKNLPTPAPAAAKKP
jgi:hypothetical protein